MGGLSHVLVTCGARLGVDLGVLGGFGFSDHLHGSSQSRIAGCSTLEGVGGETSSDLPSLVLGWCLRDFPSVVVWMWPPLPLP